MGLDLGLDNAGLQVTLANEIDPKFCKTIRLYRPDHPNPPGGRMTQAITTTIPALHARGFVDNASALPTIPPPPQKQAERTFDVSYKAGIFTRYRQ